MIDPSTAERGEVGAVPTWFGLGLIGTAVALAYIVLWRWVEGPGSLFGGDLIAYITAADRLATSGTPYHSILFQGPIVSGDNVSIGYFYPPILAQLFLAVRSIPALTLAYIWSAAQIVCLLILLPRVAALHATPTLNRSSLAIGFGLAFYPLEYATYSGNVSGWLAIGVALSLVSGARVRGPVAAVATAIKLLPAPMFVAVVLDRRSRKTAIAPMAILLGASVLLAPRAWIDFLTILPNVLRIGTATGFSNLSPAHALTDLGLAGVGSYLGWAVALGFGIAAIVTGVREGYSNRVLAMSVISLTFASSTLWDHYLGVLAPLILWAWPLAGTQARRAIALFVVVATGLWIRLGTYPEYRVILVAALIACSLAIAATRERPDKAPETQADPTPSRP